MQNIIVCWQQKQIMSIGVSLESKRRFLPAHPIIANSHSHHHQLVGRRAFLRLSANAKLRPFHLKYPHRRTIYPLAGVQFERDSLFQGVFEGKDKTSALQTTSLHHLRPYSLLASLQFHPASSKLPTCPQNPWRLDYHHRQPILLLPARQVLLGLLYLHELAEIYLRGKGTLLSKVVVGELELLFLLFALGQVWDRAVLFGGDCRSDPLDPPGHAHVLVQDLEGPHQPQLPIFQLFESYCIGDVSQTFGSLLVLLHFAISGWSIPM